MDVVLDTSECCLVSSEYFHVPSTFNIIQTWYKVRIQYNVQCLYKCITLYIMHDLEVMC